jgi:hypothetical protein
MSLLNPDNIFFKAIINNDQDYILEWIKCNELDVDMDEVLQEV